MTDCDFNRAALHPAYPIKCRTSTQRTQAPESVDTPKSLSPLDPLENGIRRLLPLPGPSAQGVENGQVEFDQGYQRFHDGTCAPIEG